MASAQVPLQWTQFYSPQFPSSSWGQSLCAHDFNHDGFDDLLATEPSISLLGQLQAGRAWILFGPRFATWFVFHADPPVNGELLGKTSVYPLTVSSAEACSIGDVNGDGESDVLLAAPAYSDQVLDVDFSGRAVLFYGPDFVQQLAFNNPRPEHHAMFGASVLLLDLTLDGRDDVLIGAPGAWKQGPDPVPAAGRVYFWDATDLSEYKIVSAPHPVASGGFGASLSTAFMDGDDVPDILVGAQDYKIGALTEWGRIYVLSGAAFQLLKEVIPPAGFSKLGDVAYVGDLTGDGNQDLVAQAYDATASCTSATCDVDQAGQAGILVGPDFASLGHAFDSPKACTTCTYGFGLNTAVADLDQDGSQDVIIGDAGAQSVQGVVQGRTYIFLGPDYATVQTLGDDFPGTVQGFGGDLAVGDFDGDGWKDVTVYSEAYGSGALTLYDVQTLAADASALSLSAGGDVQFNLDAGQAQAGNSYVGVLSISGSEPGVIAEAGTFVPLNIDAVTFAGLALLGSPLLPGFLGQLDSEGKGSFALHLPAGAAPSLVGEMLTVAAVTIEPDGNLGIGSSAVDVALEP